MTKNGTVFLMYHELALPDRPFCAREPGYTRYVVQASEFRRQIDKLAAKGWRGKNVSQAIESLDEPDTICITFDDGCETDLISAAPILKSAGFNATFYITVGFLKNPGYLSESQLRQLSNLGFEIGCHSLTHPYLTDIDAVQLREETLTAKNRLEQIAGAAVHHFSCPGGRWNQEVCDAVKSAGFRSMATSRVGLNAPGGDPFSLARHPVLRGMTIEDFLSTCRGRPTVRTRIREKATTALKGLLGNSTYDAVRRVVLKGSREFDDG